MIYEFMLNGFIYQSAYGCYGASGVFNELYAQLQENLNLTSYGDTVPVTVVFDDEHYDTEALFTLISGQELFCLGNLALFGSSLGQDFADTGEPFGFFVGNTGHVLVFTTIEGESHTLSIMDLSGTEAYIPLEYIESSGTQYIDTGFKPNSNTRVVIDFEPLPTSSKSEAYCFFGARAAKEDGEYFAFFKASSQNFNLYWEYGDLYSNIWSVADIGAFAVRRTVEANGATATIDGVTKTYPERTLQAKHNMFLFASNEKGTASYHSLARIYSCQIYDNGTLVRDFIPVKRKSDGAVGLLDKLNNAFYGNAGTGTFIAGELITYDETSFQIGLIMGLLSGNGEPSVTPADTFDADSFNKGYAAGRSLRRK